MDSDGKRCRSHANSFLLSRGFFLKNFGYDEELCGNYACDDTFFVKYMKYHGAQQWMRSPRATLTIRKAMNAGQAHTLSRDMSHNKAVVESKIRSIKDYGSEAGHSRQFLNFDWEVLKVSRRDVPPPEKRDSLWALGWWGRWVFGE